jgi:hypothetical protein
VEADLVDQMAEPGNIARALLVQITVAATVAVAVEVRTMPLAVAVPMALSE